MGALPSEAVDDHADEHERHGHDPGDVSEVLFGPEAFVVVGCRREMDDHVDRERDHPEGNSQMDQARHASDVAENVADGL